MSIDAMKQALEALERVPEIGQQAWQLRLDAIASLRLAIEQAERPYAGMTALLNSDRLRIDPVTGDVGIGSVTQAERQEPLGYWNAVEGWVELPEESQKPVAWVPQRGQKEK